MKTPVTVEDPLSARLVPVALANCKPPVNWLSVPEKVLESVRRVVEAAPVPVTAAQMMVPDESVLSAFEPEHVPKFPARVVEPVEETEKRVVVAVPAVEEPIEKRTEAA